MDNRAAHLGVHVLCGPAKTVVVIPPACEIKPVEIGRLDTEKPGPGNWRIRGILIGDLCEIGRDGREEACPFLHENRLVLRQCAADRETSLFDRDRAGEGIDIRVVADLKGTGTFLHQAALTPDPEEVVLTGCGGDADRMPIRIKHQILARLDVPDQRAAGIDEVVVVTFCPEGPAAEVELGEAQILHVELPELEDAPLFNVEPRAEGQLIHIGEDGIGREPRATLHGRRVHRAEDGENALRGPAAVRIPAAHRRVPSEAETATGDGQLSAARHRNNTGTPEIADGETLCVTWVVTGESPLGG